MLNVFAEVRPEERRATAGAFLTLLGILAGHSVLETARDALFLASLPSSRLPWVYLAIAVSSLGIYFLQQQSRRGGSDRRTLSGWLLGSAGVTIGFWFLVSRTEAWVLYAFYTWTGVLATLVVVRFWGLLGDAFTIGQAKRLFALIGAGSVSGAILGSALARMFTMIVDARHLILVGAGLLALTALAPGFLLPRPETPARGPRPRAGGTPAAEILASLRSISRHPYLRRMGAMALVSTVALTFVDFLFKNAVSLAKEPEQLGAFFATSYLVFNVLSLLAQVFLVGWLVRTFGINRVLTLLPALMVLGAVGIVSGGGLIAAFAVKLVDGGLRHSLHRTAIEVLYVPLSKDVRSRVKGLIDVVGQRGGQALASVGILLVTVTGRVEIVLGLAVAALGLAWMRVAYTLKDSYLDLFRQTLSAVSLQTRIDYPQLDLASLETLISALNSPNDREVTATMDLLAEQGRERLIPALILYHPSSEVVVRALEIFPQAGRDDFVPLTERLLARDCPEIRSATLRALAWVAPDPDVYRAHLEDRSPMVRATALIGLVSYGAPEEAKTAKESIGRIAVSGSDEEKLSLARAIRYSPGAGYERALIDLAKTPSREIRLAAARAMREILSPGFLPSLLDMLPDRALREEVRRTLVAMGTEALSALGEVLGNPWMNRQIRKQVPRSIAFFPPEQAAEILMRHYPTEPDGGVRYRMLRALGRLRSVDPELELDRAVLERVLNETLGNIFRLVNWEALMIQATNRDPARATLVQGLMYDLLKHRESLAMERLFRVLGLLHPGEDFRDLHRGIQSDKRDVRASSLELLENLLQPPVRGAVLALADTVSDHEKLNRAGPYHRRFEAGYETLLRALLEQGSTGMKCLVAYHVGELRLEGLRDALERVPSDPAGLVSRAVERALAMLGPSPGEQAV